MCSRAKTSTSHLLSASKIGLGKTRYEVMRIVEGVAKQKGVLRGEQISHGWWQRFLDRNLSLSLRSGDSTAGVRIDAVNEENMRIYFNLLKEVYDELDFAGDPERIFNMDETGVPLEPRPPKVVAHKGVKKVPYRGDNVNGTGSTYTGKEEIYQMRFEEGYDLYDPDYILWLELHHPEAVPKYRYTLTCAPTAEHSSESSTPSNIPCVLSLGGSASSLSLSDPSLVTPQLTAKTALPGGSASSLSLSDPSLGTPQSKTKTTPLVIQQVVCL